MTEMLKWRSKAELIVLVKQHPMLWDHRLDDYKHAKLKPIHWAEIADALESTPGPYSSYWNYCVLNITWLYCFRKSIAR